MGVDYDYNSNDQVGRIVYPNGTQVDFTYDDATRLEVKHHKVTSGGATILRQAYEYSDDGLILKVRETDDANSNSTISYGYDLLNRLEDEQRTGTHPYHLSYTYDAGGNRRTKVDHVGDVTTTYYYDIDAPDIYGSKANRLMYYEVRDTSGGNPGALLETVYYDYWGGSARQIVSKVEGDPVWRRTWFQFDGPGRAWMTVQDNWELNTNGTIDEDTLSRSRCTEFRYAGSGRQRYLTRALDPETLQPISCHDGRWSDYFAGGESIYTDYWLSVGDAATNDTPDYVVTNDMTRHMPGAWQSDANTSGTWSTSFIHGDQIDSMRTMTAGGGGGGPGAGTIVQRRIYTAFGELVHESGAINTRYGYAGAYGYGGGEALWFTGPHPMTLLHVGERLYDPGIGRFLQRDSVGIRGGVNVYIYSSHNPIMRLDRTGRQDDDWFNFSPIQKELNAIYQEIKLARQVLATCTTMVARQAALNTLAGLHHVKTLLQDVVADTANRINLPPPPNLNFFFIFGFEYQFGCPPGEICIA